jgi:hypothetical protein
MIPRAGGQSGRETRRQNLIFLPAPAEVAAARAELEKIAAQRKATLNEN